MSGGGIEYDSASGMLVVSGYVTGPQAIYGDYDAVVLTYFSNLTLQNALILGGAGSDGAPTVKLPYVLLAVPAPVAA